jgi:hypothetical protein
MAIRPAERPTSVRAWMTLFDAPDDSPWMGEDETTRIAGSDEVTAIERAFAERAVEAVLPYSGDPAILAAVLGGAPPNAAARPSHGEYGEFAGIVAGSMEAHVPEWRAQFAGVAGQARQIAARLIAHQAAARPRPLASRSRRETYERLRAAVAQARGHSAQLEELARHVEDATDIAELETAVARVDQIHRALAMLEAANTDPASATTSITRPWRSTL